MLHELLHITAVTWRTVITSYNAELSHFILRIWAI